MSEVEIEVGGDEPVSQWAGQAASLDVGVFENVPEAEYHRIPAINSTLLRQFNAPQTPAHAREYMKRPPKQTPAQALGAAYHAYALGQPTFGEYLILPPGENRTHKTARDAKDRGQKTLRDVEVDAIKAMKEALYAHPTIAEILLTPSAKKELTILWEETITVDGVRLVIPCKARLDASARLSTSRRCIADLKSAVCAAPREFVKSVADYDYHEQAAWYLRGAAAATGEAPDDFVFIAQEKKPPYAAAAYRASAQMLAQGALQADANLVTLARCIRDDVWPAYGQGLDEIDLPAWKVDPSLLSPKLLGGAS